METIENWDEEILEGIKLLGNMESDLWNMGVIW